MTYKTKTIGEVTITNVETALYVSRDGRDAAIRTKYVARLSDGTYLGTYYHPPAPPVPGQPGGTWTTLEEFEASMCCANPRD